MEETQFIDLESGHYGNEKNSYEDILLRQMQKCIEVLSMDRKSCFTRIKTKEGLEITPIKDLDEQIKNSVDTLKKLMQPFLKDKFETDVKKIENEIIKFMKDLGENDIMIQGTGKVKVKEALLDEEHPIMQRIKRFQSDKHREMFGVLVAAYHKYKFDIAQFSIDD